MIHPDIASQFQKLFDDATTNVVVPGAQFVVFNKDEILVNGVSGYSKLPTDDDPVGARMRVDDIHRIASAGKIAVAVLVLIVLERKLAPNGMGLDDLDDHDKLVELLPEFKKRGGSLVTKIITGFEPELSKDGRKVPILKDADEGITMRMLLTHTAGLGTNFNSPYISDMYYPTDGSKPLKGNPYETGLIDDFTTPLMVDPSTDVTYGPAAEWLGQWLVRATGKNQRRLLHEFIFGPLEMPLNEVDAALTDSLRDHTSPLYMMAPGAPPFLLPFPGYSEEGDPAPGHSHVAGGPLWSSSQAYSKFLQAILRRDGRLLSESTWDLAFKDDLTARGLSVPRPRWKSVQPAIVCDIEYFSAPLHSEERSSMNLLLCDLVKGESLTGSGPGSFGWAGVFNTYHTHDPSNGLGWILSAQTLPFFDPKVMELRDDFERLIHASFPKQA